MYVEIMIDRYPKLALAILTSKTCTMHIVSIFYDKWIISYGIPYYILTYIATQFISFSEGRRTQKDARREIAPLLS